MSEHFKLQIEGPFQLWELGLYNLVSNSLNFPAQKQIYIDLEIVERFT